MMLSLNKNDDDDDDDERFEYNIIDNWIPNTKHECMNRTPCFPPGQATAPRSTPLAI